MCNCSLYGEIGFSVFPLKCNLMWCDHMFCADACTFHPVLQSVFGWRPGAASFRSSCLLCTVGWPRGASSSSQRLRVWTEWLCTLVSRMTLSDLHCTTSPNYDWQWKCQGKLPSKKCLVICCQYRAMVKQALRITPFRKWFLWHLVNGSLNWDQIKTHCLQISRKMGGADQRNIICQIQFSLTSKKSNSIIH